MKNKFIRAWVLGLFSAIVIWSIGAAEEHPDRKKGSQTLEKTAGTPRYAVLNINNLTSWHRSDGLSNHSPQADNGLYYPRNTGNVMYQDGVVWGGKLFTGGFEGVGTAPSIQPVRVGGATYGLGTRAGYVIGTGATAVGANPNNAEVRIYRIRRDYTVLKNADGTFTDELRRDAADVNEIPSTEATDAQMQATYDQYETDWNNWPVVQQGAPYINRNGMAGYQAPPPFSATFTVDSLIAGNYDEPGIAGVDPNSPADQVIYTVFNDMNEAQAVGFVSSNPIGLEVQKTVWGYKRTDAMGNLYFQRYRLINKGGVDIDPSTTGFQGGSFYVDSMYVCQWSDPDLGSFSDDVCGCDSTRSLGFIYNGNAQDATFRNFSLAPPAGGYDFLAGPVVVGAGTDTAIFNLQQKPGYRNLGMSSFAYFSAGSPYSDPPNPPPGSYARTTGQWWKMLRSFAPLGEMASPDQPYAHPTSQITRFPLSGDPVTGTGFLDGQGTTYSFAPGDRRILLNTGPFRMAPGDTQEIYIGVVVGIGGDRTSSVAVMKTNDNAVQTTFNLRFQVSKAPATPSVSVTELDGEVILEWGRDQNRVSQTENTISQPGSYTFEGYNVYQLSSRGQQLSAAKLVTVFDKPADPRVVFDTQFDATSGQFIQVPIQFGTNAGVGRIFKFDRDYVRDINKIYNGQEYYLAITAYSIATVPGFTAALESAPQVLTVRPKVPFGTTLRSSFGDSSAVTRTGGTSDGFVVATVVSPTEVTGNNYQIAFKANSTWFMRNTTTGDTVLNNQADQSGSSLSPIADGLQVRVSGPPNDFKDFWETANSAGAHAPTYAAFAFNSSGFPTTLAGPPDRPTANPQGASWGIHTGEVGGGFSYSFFVSRVTQGGARWPILIGYDWEIRFTAAGGVGYEPNAFVTGAGTGGTVINVPFELWRIDPNNASGDVRLFPYLIDTDADGIFNLSSTDHTISGGTNDSETDWIYWVVPANMSPGQAGYNAIATDVTTNPTTHVYLGPTTAGTDAIRRMVLVNFNGGTYPTFNQNLPPTGTVYKIVTNKINTPSDAFTINTSGIAPVKSSAALEKSSAERVGVFPNPYYAFNAAETNRFARFVTFNNMAPKATIRIFNLAGQLVRRLDKDDTSQFIRWDLANSANFPVASGLYIAHVEMTLPTDGSKVTKVLKFAIIQEQEILNSY